MIENDVFSSYTGYVEEVSGLADYQDNYSAPQTTSFSGGFLPDFDYNSDYYAQTSFGVLYPVISVLHQGTTYYWYPHVYYENYYAPMNYNYPALEPVPEPCPVPCFIEEILSTSDGFDLSNTSEAAESGNSCDTRVENDSVCVSGERGEAADQHDDDPVLSRSEPALFEEDEDPNCLYEKLSSLTIQEVKSDMERHYFYKKFSLYTDVLKGYEKKKKILKNLKCGWDPFLLTIPEDRERKKAFDLKKYYFDDIVSFPRSNDIPYEEEAEKYFLYQMLGSLKMKKVRRDMKKKYNKGKKKLYREACKGHTKGKEELKNLNWICHSLDSLPEENEPDSPEIEVDEMLKNDFQEKQIEELKSTSICLPLDSTPELEEPYSVEMRADENVKNDLDNAGVAQEGPLEVMEIKKKKKRFKRIREFFASGFSSRRQDQIDMETTAEILTYFYERSEKQFRFLRSFKGLY